MANKRISAVSISKLWYLDPKGITEKPTIVSIKTLIESATEITNVHQDTWSLEEAEGTETGFTDQRTGDYYRFNPTEKGEVTMNFTIGLYDLETKAALMGGEATASTWARARETPNINKAMIALTKDNVYVVFTKSKISARQAETDGATGIAVVARAMQPDDDKLSSEYWLIEEEE